MTIVSDEKKWSAWFLERKNWTYATITASAETEICAADGRCSPRGP